MKRRHIVTMIMAAIMSMAMAMTAFAAGGNWQKNDTGWWWQRTDGSYPSGTWLWIDGNADGVAECYYFDANGYMLANTVTPDGYTVNMDGAWIENGVVQAKATEPNIMDVGIASGTAMQTNGNPVMDGKSIAPIKLNTALTDYIRMENGADLFPGLKSAPSTVDPLSNNALVYSTEYNGQPLRVLTLLNVNQITSFTGRVDQILSGVPAEGIEREAFYDNCGFESRSARRDLMASTGISDSIFGLATGSYRMAWGNAGERHFEIVLTPGADGKWYIYPDSPAYIN